MLSINDDISVLKGIGKKTESYFHKLGIYKIADLLEHYPRRYEQYPIISSVKDIHEGKMAVMAVVNSQFYEGKNNSKTLIVREAGQSLSIKWFNSPYIEKMLKHSCTYIFYGNITMFNGKYYMAQPAHFSFEDYKKIEGTIKPIYKLTSGITNDTIFKLVKQVLENINRIPEDLPNNVIRENYLLSKEDSVKCIHYPAKLQYADMARDSLAFREFYSLLYSIKYDSKHKEKNSFVFKDLSAYTHITNSLPYSLTNAQKRAIEVAIKDISSEYVARRLFQGDVGCGKTIVAIIILSIIATNGYQGVLMAPTEVLAEQHYKEITGVLSRCGLLNICRPVLLTGSTKSSEKRTLYSYIKTGKTKIIIGTHAVIQDKVEYQNLAVSIVDEQHRFGVEQRNLLSKKSQIPIHSFIMTATPIPRTTGQIIFGGMDITVIDEKPSNRKPIINYVETKSRHPVIDKFMLSQLSKGHQVYIICPMIDGDEDGKVSVTTYYESFHKKYPSIKASCLHGKLKPEEKASVMSSFERNESSVLISTTVVEVGVNVPNATVMIVEDADMFGLLQLHQLRGRVGRGDSQSYCIFCSSNDDVSEKLMAIGSTNDGFKIAELDYKLRKAGDILGTRQSGDMGFKIADILRDEQILRRAEAAAAKEVQKS